MAFTKPDLEEVWANSADPSLITAPTSGKQDTGWIVEKPTVQQTNWLINKLDQFSHHINQYGMPTWDAATEYQIGSVVLGSNAIAYQSKTVNTNKDPISDTLGNWGRLAGGQRMQEEFLTSGTWTRPATHAGDYVRVILVAGGGGGGTTGDGSGGGGAQTVIEYVDVSSLTPGSGTATVTIGAGGAANTAGSNSTFGAFLTALAGQPGADGDAEGGKSGGGAGTHSTIDNGSSGVVAGAGVDSPPSEFGSGGGGGGGAATTAGYTNSGGAGGASFGPGGAGEPLESGEAQGGGGGSWGAGGDFGQSAAANTGGGAGTGGTGGSGYCRVIWEE